MQTTNASNEVCGTIEKIELINFMCHKHLVVDLCSQVNFIVGENGSGKSAILVALALCLGAKANFTNRGKRACDVIKTGESQCIITVYLRNRGDGCLDQSVYGESIIVEKKICREGQSSYKIMAVRAGEAPKLIGRKMSDLNEIIDHFNIPIDNPCVLLMQDTSKTFLTATRAEDKYKFFLQATQLENIRDQYTLAGELCEKAKKNEIAKKEQVETMEKETLRLEAILKDGEGVKAIKERIKALEAEEKWALERDQQNKVNSIQKEIDEFQKKLDDMNLNDFNRRLEEINTISGKLSDDLNKARDVVMNLEKRKNVESDKMKTADRNTKTFKLEVEDVEKRVESSKRRVKLIRDNIEEARKHDARDTENERIEKEEKIKAAMSEVEQGKKKEEELKEQLKPLEKEMQVKQQAVRGYDDEIREMRGEIANQHSERGKLENQKKDAMSIYHRDMTLFINKIAKTNFEYPTYGPIGSYVKLKDNKWNLAIESCIKRSTLASFIVRSENDKRKLREVASSIGFDVQVFVYDIKYGDDRYRCERPNYETISSVIDVQENVVYNILVDHIHVEQIAVAETRKDAKALVERGATSIYLQNGANVMKVHKTEGFFPYRIPPRTIYGGQNIDDALKALDLRVRNLSVELKGKEELRKQADDDKYNWGKQINELRAQLRVVERETRNAESRKKEAENIAIKEPESVEELEASLKVSIAKSEEIEKEREKKKEEFDVLQKRLEETKESYQNVCGEKTQAENDLAERRRTFEEVRKQMEETKAQADGVETKKKDIREILQSKTEDLVAEMQKHDNIKNEAIKFEMVQTTRKVETIVLEKKKLEKRKERISSENIDYEAVEREYQKKKEQLENVGEQLTSVTNLSDILKDELEKRKGKYKDLLRVTSKKTMEMFDSYLKKKPNCKGKIRLDHTRRILDIEVSMDNERERDAKTLSGGEKSFSTVCLLLSLWNVVDCPFRAMDEFDVFLDSVTRKVAINALMETATFNDRRQYIFITPHNLDGVQSSDSVHVFMINRPDRGVN
ncbi:structural maintenance of chromosome protein, putative [Entamoeba invadens IP1]|uniref:Structural maintenance of chromosome protein, putative n=1 Tax=Entamoeba invadens IP1 TaxID=370355 RepID=A0A0A1UES8_ENTIV|nr:structural maintenance of chromosome protein, putative [Entamoeba invadens IP1]ELP95070.1 structural maintenance of chromosome protein, putative [Entamoeba invadens IP1]|eukprot:XP_004261841.1 structural maintenance of chromosome protein, putative [Entamoeba invadens IP1]